MYVLKGYRDKLANDIWVSDHMTHDVFVRNDDFFPDLPTNAAVRPWLTAIIDYRTRKCLGWTWCANPSSDSINSAMRMALLQFGKPAECFYVDNGKDFKSLGRVNSISPELSGALERLQIVSQYCQPRHPQSKHIERWFKTLHQRFDVLWRPFYSGTSPKDRPEECDRQLAEHKKLIKSGQPQNSPLPLASEFCAVAEHWIEKYNAQHQHSGEGMDGRTPDEVFNQQYPAENRRLLGDGEIRALDILLRRRESRRVREGGCVFMANHRYEPIDAASAARMTLEIEREVIVACDPANMGEAIACDLDGHYLATLQASKLMEHGPTSREEVRASMRQRNAVKRAMKDYVGGLIAASYARGEQSEMELLREGAGLNARPMRAQRSRAVAVMQLPKVAAAPIGYDRVADKFFEEEN
jgi:putative transposase